jgi:CheY-like chemotaxis protein
MTEEPRELLNLVCEDFREMFPNRAENYCCTGGGGAMSMAEYTPQRLKSASVKAEQLKATGASVVVTSCHNCVDGLTDLIRHYKLDMKVAQLVNLVSEALVMEERVPVPARALPLSGYRVVVADDEPDQLLYLSTILEDNGATVFTAETSDEALELVLKEKPDLLTLDLAMPGRAVTEVYEILRKRPELSDLKICIISGRPEMRKTIYARTEVPPDGYMDKPVGEEHLVKGLRKILELSEEKERESLN